MTAAAFLHRVQHIDRRWVYLVLFLVLSAPFLISFSLPLYPDTYTRQTFDTIEGIAADPADRARIVFVITNWGPGTSGENAPQYEVLLRHLLRKRQPFVFITTAADPVFIRSAEHGLAAALEAERQYAAAHDRPVPTWTYGQDYLNLGMAPTAVFAPIAKTLLLETLSFAQVDGVYKRPLTPDEFPILRHFRGVQDIALVLIVTAGDEAKDVVGIVQREVRGLKVATATMGIVANDLYPYVKSGQLAGLINSARGAAEYNRLLNPDERTTPVQNSMSLGKSLLLLLVIAGNVAYLLSRRFAQQGVSGPLNGPRQPLVPLPKGVFVALFAAFVALFVVTGAIDVYRLEGHDEAGQAQPTGARAATTDELGRPVAPERAALRAQAAFYRLVTSRTGEYLAAFLTLGIMAFLLGDNRLYRVVEGVMIGGALAYALLENWDSVLGPKWFYPILAAARHQPGAHPGELWWLLLVLPGALWYFTYSERYRWLNQLIVAAFIGFAIGPEFGKQIGLLIPQVVDSIQPVWPFVTDPALGQTVFSLSRFEHLVFIVVLVFSLLYFVFFLRPKGPAGRGAIAFGRLVMMVGFGVMFANAVNTRLSWLAPRVGFLLQDWLGKLF